MQTVACEQKPESFPWFALIILFLPFRKCWKLMFIRSCSCNNSDAIANPVIGDSTWHYKDLNDFWFGIKNIP